MSPDRTLLVIDGNSLAHRAFHAYQGQELRRSDGSPCWAVHGFVALLTGILDKVRPDGLVVGFDDATRNRRRERYEAYKGTRSEKHPDLVTQLAEIPTLLQELGVCVRVLDGWEADDILGTSARLAEEACWGCVLATSDRDSFQLVTLRTRVLRLASGLDNATWVDPVSLRRDCGVDPDQYLHYAALRGDTSDNLPGVAGIGEKTAAKLLGALGDGLRALEDADGAGTLITSSCGAAALRKLRHPEARVCVERNLDLMRIERTLELELGEGLTETLLGTQREHIEDTCTRWELPSLRVRLQTSLISPAERRQFDTQAEISAQERWESEIADQPDDDLWAGMEHLLAPPEAPTPPSPRASTPDSPSDRVPTQESDPANTPTGTPPSETPLLPSRWPQTL